MEDEYEIENSPLCRKETRDGHTVEIEIYRGENADGWILEVVDAEGASTVWDERFPTDQAALDAVMETIKEEGISTFLDPPNPELH
jgi:hypothetical protein